ncbi:transglycosylase SLT domain-containing protein [Bacillus tamaricis]|uniref:Transglycosylase SLT domain-containing protein n=2 Tax=Evansella tamaricis TaxID=2069301 RepID=A0ABS6JIC4_9BACI|nr:transglycosylase SLT domain-containing protein [Evansella tamaricis]
MATAVIILLIVGTEHMKLKEQIREMEVSLNAQEQEYKQALNVERIKGFVDYSEREGISSSYLSWKEAHEIAEHFYEDSDGRFQKEWAIFLAMETDGKELDPFLVYELLKVETGGTFDPHLIGPETPYGHAYGLAQFMTNTGPWIAEMAGIPYEQDKLFDPIYSIQLAIVYLDFLYQQYGDWNHALTAYHRGIYGLEQYIEENGHAESWYAVLIQENAEDSQLLSYEQGN